MIPMPSNIVSEQIANLAYKISKQEKSYEQWIWSLAEVTLYLEQGSIPQTDAINQLATIINEQRPKIDMIHWLIAERQLLCREKFGSLCKKF